METIKVKFKKIHPHAVTPYYSKPGDAGMDLIAIAADQSAHFVEYRTGIAVEIPEGYVGLIYPRSSISNVGLQLANSVGVIDSGYRGEIRFRFKKVHDIKTYSDPVYNIGDKIGQLMVVPYPKVDLEEVASLSESARGEGGFGSTGKKI